MLPAGYIVEVSVLKSIGQFDPTNGIGAIAPQGNINLLTTANVPTTAGNFITANGAETGVNNDTGSFPIGTFVAFRGFNSQNEAFIRGGSAGNITQADQGLFYAFGGAANSAAVEGSQLQVIFELIRVV